MPQIDIRDLSKSYPLDFAETARTMRDAIFGRTSLGPALATKIALENVNLRIDSGERIGIIGRNGAGKSTLLHLIAGVAEPTSGRLQIDGHVTSILTLGIGMREEITGRQNIYLDGEVQGRSHSEIDAVIDQIVEFAELGEFIDRPVRTYSTGMKSRLAFAMISYIEPEILLIDEALSVGDASFSAKATRRIREICASGKIVVVVSHGMSSIREICNRCIWLDNGRIVMDGDPQTITEAYVKAVRAADEVKLLEMFKSQLAAESLVEGYAVTLLETKTEGQNEARSVLPAERPQEIRIAGSCHEVTPSMSVRLLIERLDGLPLVDELAPLSDFQDQSTPGVFAAEVVLPPAMAYGIYRVEASITDGGKSLARRATVMEITCDVLPTGGRPALLYPYTITSEPLVPLHAGI